jgi:hypothetical protein
MKNFESLFLLLLMKYALMQLKELQKSVECSLRTNTKQVDFPPNESDVRHLTPIIWYAQTFKTKK